MKIALVLVWIVCAAAFVVPEAAWTVPARRLFFALIVVHAVECVAFLPRLRAQWPGLEVVLMSGDALPASLEQDLAATGGRFLRKPFSPKTLLRLLDESAGPASTAGSPASRTPER